MIEKRYRTANNNDETLATALDHDLVTKFASEFMLMYNEQSGGCKNGAIVKGYVDRFLHKPAYIQQTSSAIVPCGDCSSFVPTEIKAG